ncbi:MAG: RluA family pseudouridine synthase [Bacteriovoracia bacterium]
MKQFSILFEDECLLAIHKPSGVPSIRQTANDQGTVANFVLAYRPEQARLAVESHPAELEAGALHRLDNGTSGVLLFAKTPEAFLALKAAWKKSVRKLYRARCSAHPSPIAAPLPLPLTIDVPLARPRKSSRRVMPAVGTFSKRAISGKPLPAHTIVHAAKRHGEVWDLEVEIRTGVMHQIRCHLAHIGLPILGDEIYGEKKTAPSSSTASDSRLWLHAWRLCFLHPITGKETEIEAPLPANWNTGAGDPPKN